MAKKSTNNAASTAPLPPLLPIDDIQGRLSIIFPDTFPDRDILVGVMAARVIYVFLYGGFIEGFERFLRPSHIYFFTDEQASKIDDADRKHWLSVATRPGYRSPGKRWYADNSRESIRDDLMRNRFLHLGIMNKKPGYAITASTPINYLKAHFATLFDPQLTGQDLVDAILVWQQKNLNQATLQRMALRAQGIHASAGDLLIDMPDGTRIRISAGPSSDIAKGLIEEFTQRHMQNPAVLWLSASDKKSYPQFVALSASVGLQFDLNAELPDLILADMGNPVRFLFCEVVATDGPVTDARKEALLSVVRSSRIPEDSVQFLTAFEDREAAPFKKNFSKLTLDSMVWFRTEPDLLVTLSTENRKIFSDEFQE